MAIQQHTVSLKLRDDDWKTLGVSRVQPRTVACEMGLVEGKDFEIDYELGRVRRLRELGEDEQGLCAFTLAYDDRADELAAAQTQRGEDLALVMRALPADARVAFGRLVGVEQQAAEDAAVAAAAGIV